jgi:hypothetical protein
MNPTQTGADEIARYLDGVRAALADLPPTERDELLEDLPDHLAEVAAESEQPLTERLGPPERYAAELRAAAGLAPRTGAVPASMARTARRLGGYVSIIDIRLGPLVGEPRLRDFLVQLRPAWWVLRGYILAVVLIGWFDDPSLLPRVGGSRLLGLIIVFAFVLASIWLGRRTGGLSTLLRRTVAVTGGLVAVLGLFALSDVDAWAHQGRLPGVYDNESGVTDVFPYGPDGKPLTGVTLYDQNGNSIDLGHPWRCRTGAFEMQQFTYPLCGFAFPLSSVPPATPTGPAVPTPSPS